MEAGTSTIFVAGGAVSALTLVVLAAWFWRRTRRKVPGSVDGGAAEGPRRIVPPEPHVRESRGDPDAIVRGIRLRRLALFSPFLGPPRRERGRARRLPRQDPHGGREHGRLLYARVPLLLGVARLHRRVRRHSLGFQPGPRGTNRHSLPRRSPLVGGDSIPPRSRRQRHVLSVALRIARGVRRHRRSAVLLPGRRHRGSVPCVRHGRSPPLLRRSSRSTREAPGFSIFSRSARASCFSRSR